jgi:hypothetical protein
VIDIDDIGTRFDNAVAFLDERGRRLFAANEALAIGRGGVAAISSATGIARSTIGRGVAALKAGRNELGERIRRAGGGRKRASECQPGLLAALDALIEGAIRGVPCSPLRWVSGSQRHIARALLGRGFKVSHQLVGRLLVTLDDSCQANRKTREGASHPDRNAQFEHINATVQAAIAAGEPASRWTRRSRNWSATLGPSPRACFKNPGRELRRKHDPEPVRVHDFKLPELGKLAPYGSTTSPPIMAGSALASMPIPLPSRSRASAAGGRSSARHAIPRRAAW